MLNYVFILHFYIFLLDWLKNASQIFLQWSKKVFFFSMQICDGKREKRRSSFLLRKEAFSQTIALKICLLSCPCKFITSELPLGCWRFTWVPLDSSNVSTSTQFTKSFLFSKQWNKSLDCNQAINKC